MKKIIKVFFCILTCLIISIPQIYAEESKTKELSEAVEEKKDANVEESLDKGKKEVTEEPVERIKVPKSAVVLANWLLYSVTSFSTALRSASDGTTFTSM